MRSNTSTGLSYELDDIPDCNDNSELWEFPTLDVSHSNLAELKEQRAKTVALASTPPRIEIPHICVDSDMTIVPETDRLSELLALIDDLQAELAAWRATQ